MRRDRYFMRRALMLARQAAGRTSPNPLVGAVVVKDGRIVGEGYHRQAGTPHAEVHALAAAGPQAAGATLYVTLEPCNHHGRTPPCTETILAAGIRRVVAAVPDPNPLVAGRGLARLREAGVEVVTGVLEEEARLLNEAFFIYITTRRPMVVLKMAMTMDGKTAAVSGESRWISGETSRQIVHRLRSEMDAVMVGIGTVLADDPRLTARPAAGRGRDPIRIVVDSTLRLPPDAAVLRTPSTAPLVVATTDRAPRERRLALESAGAEVLPLPEREGRVDLAALLTELGRREIMSVLLEGGATLNAAALAAGMVDKWLCFVAPKLVGGTAAPGPVGGPGVTRISEAWRLERLTAQPSGEDVLLTAYTPAAAAIVFGDPAGAGGMENVQRAR